jgi:hypothetical protein
MRTDLEAFILRTPLFYLSITVPEFGHNVIENIKSRGVVMLFMMNKAVTEFLDFNCILSNMKETDYKNTLAVTALIELLTDKGIITKKDFSAKAEEIECADLAGVIARRRTGIKKLE